MALQEPRYERNPDYIYRKILDEAVLVPIHQDVADMDCIYTLNSVGDFVWRKLETATTEADLQQAILNEYAAEPEVIADDLKNFLSEMTAIGAIRKV